MVRGAAIEQVCIGEGWLVQAIGGRLASYALR